MFSEYKQSKSEFVNKNSSFILSYLDTVFFFLNGSRQEYLLSLAWVRERRDEYRRL